jgi:hypothetical protein
MDPRLGTKTTDVIAKMDLRLNTKAWYQNGELHRTDGPAIERASGSKSWYQNDKLHRTDGPAFEYTDGSKAWYLNDKELSEFDWKREVAKLKRKPVCENKLVEIDGVKYKLVPA